MRGSAFVFGVLAVSALAVVGLSQGRQCRIDVQPESAAPWLVGVKASGFDSDDNVILRLFEQGVELVPFARSLATDAEGKARELMSFKSNERQATYTVTATGERCSAHTELVLAGFAPPLAP